MLNHEWREFFIIEEALKSEGKGRKRGMKNGSVDHPLMGLMLWRSSRRWIRGERSKAVMENATAGDVAGLRAKRECGESGSPKA